MLTQHHKNIAALTHLSALSKFIIPLGNFIVPVVLWTLHKDKSEFVDQNGKQIINFQISLLLYSVLIGAITIPLFVFGALENISILEVVNGIHHNIDLDINDQASVLLIGFVVLLIIIAIIITVFEIIFIILATTRASNGQLYKYPLTINFLK
jgi:uncharacterized Tic20 family protein